MKTSMIQRDTMGKVFVAMADVGRLMSEHFAPNGTLVMSWLVGARMVIVEVYRTGGASHFVQMNNGSWEDMKDEMQCLSECDYAGVGKYLLHVADRRK